MPKIPANGDFFTIGIFTNSKLAGIVSRRQK
jgi:hypothetical protein